MLVCSMVLTMDKRVVVGWADHSGSWRVNSMALMLGPSEVGRRVWLRASEKAGHSGLEMAAMTASEAAAKTVWKVVMTKDVRWVAMRVRQLAVSWDVLWAVWRVGLLDFWMERMMARPLAAGWVVPMDERADAMWAELWGRGQGSLLAAQRVRLKDLTKVERWVRRLALRWGAVRGR